MRVNSMDKEIILAIILIILLPFIAFLWSYINCKIVEFIIYLYYKWNLYRIKKDTEYIKRLSRKSIVKGVENE